MAWLTGLELHKQFLSGRIKIDPYSEDQCNPNSYDYRLGDKLKKLKFNSKFDGEPCIDPRIPMEYEEFQIPKEGYLLTTPNAYLGFTKEKFGSDHFASLVTGKSSIGRLFIKNHACAGLIDQGFYGHITLEITAKLNTLIFPNMRFGQIFWFDSQGDCQLYKGRYSTENAAIPSQIFQDWDQSKWK
jgi:dCTP deaminase